MGKHAPQSILIHAINYAPEMIGCAKYTSELAHYLSTCGRRVEVVTTAPHYPGWTAHPPYRAGRYMREMLNGVEIIRCPMLICGKGAGVWRLIAPLTFAFSAAPIVIWRALRNKPDVILCVEPTLFAAPSALLAARLSKARAVLHVQDLEVDAAFAVGHLKGRLVRTIARRIEALLLRRFDKIVTISEHMREALLAKGVVADKVKLARNWVAQDLMDAGRNRTTAKAYRDELGIAVDKKVVLYSGHIGMKQALGEVLKAARLLHGRKDVLFVIAGEGPLKDKLVASARDLSNVLLLSLQPQTRFADFLQIADLHVLPQDGKAADFVLPSKLGPMLASGRPVIAMADPGTELHRLLQGAAWLTPTGDAEALATAIDKAVDQDASAHIAHGLSLSREWCSVNVLPFFERTLFEDDLKLAGSSS